MTDKHRLDTRVVEFIRGLRALAPMYLAALTLQCSSSSNPSSGPGSTGGTSTGGASSGSGTGGGTAGPGGMGGGTGADGSAGNAPGGAADASTGAEDDAPAPSDIRPGSPDDFGPNVLVFDPSMPMAMIQSRIAAIAAVQETSQFGTARYAYLFKPGHYDLDVRLGYYMQAIGLGRLPDDVTITGAVRSKADARQGNATLNFWRSAENMAITPTLDANTAVWAVSQGTSLRRIHVLGPLDLWDGGFSSGGFVADSKIDGTVNSGSQQQFLSRNSDFTSWVGGTWNMVFVGTVRPPAGAWPASPYTVVATTPVIREKPFLFVDDAGNYSVMVPALNSETRGISWTAGAAPGVAVSLAQFYIPNPMRDNAASINAALAQGRHLLFSPGVYHLADTIRVERADTIVLGLGLTTLVPDRAGPVMTIADVDGVKVGGIIFDAGPMDSTTLLEFGMPGSSGDHASNPTHAYDVSCRIGGATVGTVTTCLTINSNHVIADNLWLWRADHGAGANWTVNKSKTGLIVNGNDVTVYGLFVEHFQEYQTLWNANGGRVFFYQSEMPYDPPTQADWHHGTVNGFASYKVADTVTTHDAWGLGVYSVFRNAVVAENAIETAIAPGVTPHHMIAVWITGAAGSSITHVINGTGTSVPQSGREARTAY